MVAIFASCTDCQTFFGIDTVRPESCDVIQAAWLQTNVAVIEADSLLLKILSSSGLDFGTAGGGQMIHFIYILAFPELTSRGCLFQVYCLTKILSSTAVHLRVLHCTAGHFL